MSVQMQALRDVTRSVSDPECKSFIIFPLQKIDASARRSMQCRFTTSEAIRGDENCVN
jgi:hypothetical protein